MSAAGICQGPGINWATCAIGLTTFLTTFLTLFHVFLNQPNSSSPVIGFRLAIPAPTTDACGSISSSKSRLSTAASNSGSSIDSGGRTISPGLTWARVTSPPRPASESCKARSAIGACDPTSEASIKPSMYCLSPSSSAPARAIMRSLIAVSKLCLSRSGGTSASSVTIDASAPSRSSTKSSSKLENGPGLSTPPPSAYCSTPVGISPPIKLWIRLCSIASIMAYSL